MAGKNSGLSSSPLPIAAPSCVISGNVAENAAFLAEKVAGIGLCFFETNSCLAYTAADLPPALANIPRQWHVHLPLDLPWESGGRKVAEICLELCAKIEFLVPTLAVLHPPPSHKRQLLADFATRWENNLAVALENIAACDILELGQNFLVEHGFDFCLDVGHALGYGQRELLESPLARTARIWHWSAPGNGDQHLPLIKFTASQLAVAEKLARQAAKGSIQVLELFHWRDIAESIPVFCNLPGIMRRDYDI